jgi:hypothetical protein
MVLWAEAKEDECPVNDSEEQIDTLRQVENGKKSVRFVKRFTAGGGDTPHWH